MDRSFRMCLALLFVTVVCADRVEAAEQPNIVVLLCDDLGYGDLGCYGHPVIETPNLDKLAADGMRFTDFYSAAPVCSPSRVGLLTGRSPNRAGVYDWIPPARGATPNRRDEVHMRATEVTIPSLLKQAGYQTCLSGKWHCNSKFNSSDQPQPDAFGFDHWLATQNNAHPSHENPNNFVRNGEPIGLVEDYSCQVVVEESLRWLRGIDEEDPFFLYVPFHEPHEPVASPPDLVARYRDQARNEDEAQYFANVANVDRAVGTLLAGLEELDLAEDTLIIFTSDNGPETLNRYRNANRSYGRPGPLRGMKLHTTDAGFRVAGIMHWPGKIAPGQVSSQVVSSLDFLPTFCALAGVEPPSDLALDGINLVPSLGAEHVERQQPLVWAYYNSLNEHRVAMREGRWKVLAKLNQGSLRKFTNVTEELLPVVKNAKLTDIEIYDVTSDIDEQEDLAQHDSELTSRLRDRLEKAYAALVAGSHVW